jgi:adenosine deaminase
MDVEIKQPKENSYMKKVFLIFTVLLFGNYVRGITLEEIRQIPKAELHLHLGGSYPLNYLKTIATLQEFNALKKGIDQFVSGIDYTQCFFVFDLINKIVNTNQRVEDGTYHLCRELQKDGVTYVEIRTGLKDLDSGFEDYLKAVINGIAKASNNNFKAKVLLSIRRASSLNYVQSTIDLALKYKNRGVIGIDISGNSVTGDIISVLPVLIEGKNKGLSFVVHMGESPLEKGQIVLLEQLQPVRIGHGVHLLPEALDWIKINKIPVEVCLSSSVCVRMVNDYISHPGLQLYSEDHPIIICTDDPLIFRTTLTQEYMYFAQEKKCSLEQLKHLIKKSYTYRLGN